MDKRSEIREGIDELIGEFMSEMGCEFTCMKAETKALDMKDRLTDVILRYLDKNGVALKVERELPRCNLLFDERFRMGWDACGGAVKNTGYVAVIPLIDKGITIRR